jgi:aldehyde dehydrogenase (NAD+)
MFCTSCDVPAKGFFCRPTIFTNVAQSNRIAQEEIFGPVLTIQSFRTDDEVIEKANNTPMDFQQECGRIKVLRYSTLPLNCVRGVVWANTFNQFDPTSPFGGYKESGYGREGGLHGLMPYLNLLSIN